MTDPCIDLTVFNDLQDATGEDFAAELVTTFLDEAPGMIAELRQAASATDADAYRRAAHSIKSNASTFGASALATLARDMELGEMQAAQAIADIDALEAEFARAANALRDLINA